MTHAFAFIKRVSAPRKPRPVMNNRLFILFNVKFHKEKTIGPKVHPCKFLQEETMNLRHPIPNLSNLQGNIVKYIKQPM